MSDQDLAVREEQPQALAPREVIASATEQATVLMEIVKAKNLFATVSGKMYLEAEAWEVILAFNKVAPDVVYVKPIYEDEKLVAYEAKVNLLDQFGVLRGSGIAECSMDSFPTRGRVGRDKDKAAKSTAQTWAISKAARMAFSWVAVLAGFEPTPASEMHNNPDEPNEYGTCQVHDVPYFKTGNMRSPAHKLNGRGWCNKPIMPRMDGSTPTDVRSSRAEPSSEAEGAEQPPESDGGPPLFPDVPTDQPLNPPKRKFANAGAFRTALEQDFGLNTTADVNAALEKAGLGPLNQVGNFTEAYATLAAHRGQPKTEAK